MKTYYKIIIVGGIIILFGTLFSLLTPVSTFADQLKEVLVVNFPGLQNVLITNEEPINVNVVDQSSEPETKILTFFDNECSLSNGDYSPTIETEGYKRIAIYPENLGGLSWGVFTSIDGSNWHNYYGDSGSQNHSVKIYDIVGSYIRIGMFGTPIGRCVDIKGYLMK